MLSREVFISEQIFIATFLFNPLDHTLFSQKTSIIKLLKQLYQIKVDGLYYLAVHSSNWCNNIIKFIIDDEICESISSAGLVVGSGWSMMIPLCDYWIYIHCVYFLSFSAWFFSLVGIQYIIYLFNSEYNKMNNLGLLIKIIEFTYFIVVIVFCYSRRGKKRTFHLIVFWMLAVK